LVTFLYQDKKVTGVWGNAPLNIKIIKNLNPTKKLKAHFLSGTPGVKNGVIKVMDGCLMIMCWTTWHRISGRFLV